MAGTGEKMIQVKISNSKWAILGVMDADSGELTFFIHGVPMKFNTVKEVWNYWETTHDEHGTDVSSHMRYAETH
jgi:hypothetical protein